jgi:hypothetical protein
MRSWCMNFLIVFKIMILVHCTYISCSRLYTVFVDILKLNLIKFLLVVLANITSCNKLPMFNLWLLNNSTTVDDYIHGNTRGHCLHRDSGSIWYVHMCISMYIYKCSWFLLTNSYHTLVYVHTQIHLVWWYQIHNINTIHWYLFIHLRKLDYLCIFMSTHTWTKAIKSKPHCSYIQM